MKIGFIGFGMLGSAIVSNLLTKNYEIAGWNRTAGKMNRFPVEKAESPADLFRKTDIVILNLFDSAAVEEVLAGKEGLLASGADGKVIIDTTTNHFEKVLKFHSLVASKGGIYLESPVLGSVLPAGNGTLTVLVSGRYDAFEKAGGILNSIGRKIFYMGEAGMATRMKLINNLVLGSFMAAIAESVSLGEAAGMTKERVIEILSEGAGSSAVLSAKREKLLKEDFSPHFSVQAISKDIGYLTELAEKLGKKSLLAEPLRSILGISERSGMGELDFSALYKTLKSEHMNR